MNRATAFNALIRTHHVTSRKKVHRLRKAAENCGVSVLVRSGGAPGLMYAEGPTESAVSGWVAAVQALRYKDFRCVHKPAACRVAARASGDDGDSDSAAAHSFREVASVASFGDEMARRGLGEWWQRAMRY